MSAVVYKCMLSQNERDYHVKEDDDSIIFSKLHACSHCLVAILSFPLMTTVTAITSINFKANSQFIFSLVCKWSSFSLSRTPVLTFALVFSRSCAHATMSRANGLNDSNTSQTESNQGAIEKVVARLTATEQTSACYE